MIIRKKMRRQATVVLSVLGAAAVLTACGGSSQSNTPAPAKASIKVGVMLDQSGTYKFIGQPALAGVKAWFDALNKKGGVDGHHVVLDIQDDRADTATARTAYKTLSDDGAVVVIGPAASATLTPVAPLAADLKLPDLTLAALSSLHRPAQPYQFAAGLFVGDSGAIDAAWIAQQAKTKGITSPKVAALSLDTPSVAEFRNSLKKYIPTLASGELVRNDVVAVSATDMSSAVIPIAAAKPDFIPVGLLSSQVPGTVTSLRNRGITAPVINYFVGSDQATFAAANDHGYYAVRQYAEPSETGVAGLKQMAVDAKADGQDSLMTNAWFTYGYVQGQLVTEALKHCADTCDGTKMRAALEGIHNFKTNGLSGDLGVSATDHMFVTQGRVFGWDANTKTAVPQGGWISAPKQ